MNCAIAPDIEDGFFDSNMIQQGMAEDHAHCTGSLNFCTLLRARRGRAGGTGGFRGAFSVEFDTKSINSVGENM